MGGVKVFVNNAGFNAPSTAARDITDTNDGQINITGIAKFIGFVDLQGRANDSGATVDVYNQSANSGATSWPAAPVFPPAVTRPATSARTC